MSEMIMKMRRRRRSKSTKKRLKKNKDDDVDNNGNDDAYSGSTYTFMSVTTWGIKSMWWRRARDGGENISVVSRSLTPSGGGNYPPAFERLV